MKKVIMHEHIFTNIEEESFSTCFGHFTSISAPCPTDPAPLGSSCCSKKMEKKK